MMRSRYLCFSLVLLFAAGFAQQGYARMRTFNDLAGGTGADLRNTALEIAYTGPTNKPFPAVILSGGVDGFKAHDALQNSFNNAIPLASVRSAFVVGPVTLSRALKSVAKLKGTSSGAVVGLYAVAVTTGDTASVLLDKTQGRQALRRLSETTTDPNARRAILRLARMIFPH